MISHKPPSSSGSLKPRIVKFAISTVLYCWDRLFAAACTVVGYRPPGVCIVLYYHSVRPEERAQFAWQLDTLRRLGKLIDSTQELSLERGSRHLAVTFDDAFENFLTVALPELQERKIPSTMFVISGALGKAFGPISAAEKVMTPQQLAALPRELVSLGSHTETHPFLPELDDAAARQELRESKSTLEKLLGREVSTFSFPFGGFSRRLIQICREVGYRRVFTTLPEFTDSLGSGVFVVGRVRVDPSDWPWEFRMKASGAYRWLPAAIRWKGKLLSSKEKTAAPSETRPKRSLIQDWNGPGAIFL